MKQRIRTLAAFSALAGLLVLGTQGLAQVKKGKSRPASTKHLMAGIVAPNCAPLGKDLQGAGPADEKGWDAAAMKAAILNEMSHVLMEDGRCPDSEWAAACKTLGEQSLAVLARIEARDAAGAREAFTMVTGSCRACHTKHKK